MRTVHPYASVSVPELNRYLTMHWGLEKPAWDSFRDNFPQLSQSALCLGCVGGHRAQVFAEERAMLEQMGTQRAAQFATGRACAHSAVRAVGLTPRAILREGRRPIWPDQCTGAISHSEHIGGALVSRSHRGVGLDLERIGRVTPRLYRTLFTETEQRTWPAVGLEPALCAAIAFGAKEAGYKATHTIVGEYIAFKDAEVQIHADGRFSISYIGQHDANRVADVGIGYWSCCDEHVLTAFFID